MSGWAKGRHEGGLVTHGMSDTPTYKSWGGMIQRCTNPNNPRYADWGGRGITVCPEWKESFAAFLRDMGPRPEGMTLDRIDVDGNYEPGNCRWATVAEQNANRRPRTHCPRGHLQSPENVYVKPGNGDRLCLPCKRRKVACEVCGKSITADYVRTHVASIHPVRAGV